MRRFLVPTIALAIGAAAILADQQVTVHEAELLRGIADSLGCPMPPALSGQPQGRRDTGASGAAAPPALELALSVTQDVVGKAG